MHACAHCTTFDQHTRMRTFHPHWINTHACAHYIHIVSTRTKKEKLIRGNHKPHMNKTLRKAVTLRSKLKNPVNKSKDARYKNV